MSWRRLAGLWVGWWLAAMGTWLLLTSTVAFNEVVTGLGAAAIAATVIVAVHRHEQLDARARAGWVRYAAPIPIRIVVDIGLLTSALVRHLSGRRLQGSFTEVRTARTATAAERRAMQALSTIAVSMAPNHYVVDFDDDRGTVLVHGLVRRDADTLQDLLRGP